MSKKLLIGMSIVVFIAMGASIVWLGIHHRNYRRLQSEHQKQRRRACDTGKAWISGMVLELTEKGDAASAQVSQLFGYTTSTVKDVLTWCMPDEELFVIEKITDFRTTLGVGGNSRAALKHLAELRARIDANY